MFFFPKRDECDTSASSRERRAFLPPQRDRAEAAQPSTVESPRRLTRICSVSGRRIRWRFSASICLAVPYLGCVTSSITSCSIPLKPMVAIAFPIAQRAESSWTSRNRRRRMGRDSSNARWVIERAIPSISRSSCARSRCRRRIGCASRYGAPGMFTQSQIDDTWKPAARRSATKAVSSEPRIAGPSSACASARTAFRTSDERRCPFKRNLTS